MLYTCYLLFASLISLTSSCFCFKDWASSTFFDSDACSDFSDDDFSAVLVDPVDATTIPVGAMMSGEATADVEATGVYSIPTVLGPVTAIPGK